MKPNSTKKQLIYQINRRKFLKSASLSVAGLSLLKAKAFAGAAEKMGLKDYYSNDFKIGTAISGWTLRRNDKEILDLIAREFNAITAENDMKWGPIHPTDDRWNFETADKLVEFGQKNNMYVLGHVLVWHSQVPRGLFTDENGNQISKEALTNKMENHITTLVDRYKGKVDAWDVVNESITPEEGYRKSKWFEIMGPEFMEKAFHLAHEVDPDAHLLYNDYGMTDSKRRDFVVELVKKYKKKGVPIQGIGMQGHYNLNRLNLKAIEESIEAFAATGMRVHITELDLDVLPSAWGNTAEISTNIEYDKKLNPYVDGLPKDVEDKFTKGYEDLFKLFLKHRDKIERVTFWGVSDDMSWKNNFPVRGRTNYPLLFDREHKPKDAYHAVIGLKK